jgi:hypothetical protein
MEWTDPAQDMGQWRVLANMVMNLWVHKILGYASVAA